MLSAEQIELATRWLEGNASNPIRYLTGVNIRKLKIGSNYERQLWSSVEEDPQVKEIFSKQRGDGSWCDGGSWASKPSYLPSGGYTPVSPKYVTTVWLLSILGDLGYTISDQRIARAVEWTLKYMRPNGIFGETLRPPIEDDYNENPRNIPCRMAIQLTGLCKVGAAKDPRVRNSIDLLIRWQRGDGGWLQEGHLEGTVAPYKIWDRSCPWATFFAVSALYHSGILSYKKPLMRGLEFLLWHLDQKPEEELRRFFWRGHETVKELVMFSELGFDPGCRSIAFLLKWLTGMYDCRLGYFKYKGKPASKMNRREDGSTAAVMKHRLFHVAEDDWLTYRALRILKGFQG